MILLLLLFHILLDPLFHSILGLQSHTDLDLDTSSSTYNSITVTHGHVTQAFSDLVLTSNDEKNDIDLTGIS